MESVLHSLFMGFGLGILVTFCMYAAGDPNESLAKMRLMAAAVSFLSGFGAAGIYLLILIEVLKAKIGGLEAFIFFGAGLAGVVGSLLVFLIAEIRHQFKVRASRSPHHVVRKYRRDPSR